MKRQHMMDTKNSLRIAVIDDEIASDIVGLGCRVEKVSIATNHFPDRYCNNHISHSTVVTKILQAYTNPLTHYSITNYIVALNDQHCFDVDTLLKALRECAILRPHIVIMSIGSTMPSDASLLYPLCEALISDGTIIIAATSNDNVFTFPASFENVIAVRYRHNNDAPITVCTRDFLGTNFSVSYNRSELARLTGVDTLPSNSFAVPVIAAEIINSYFQFSSLSASDIIRILMKINKYPHCDSSYSSSPIYESERPLIIKISSKRIIQHIPRIIKVLKHKYDLEAICLTPKTNDIAHQFYCVPQKDIDTFFTNKLYAHIRSDILFIIEMEYEKYDIEINLQASTVFFTIAEGLYKHQYNITPNILEEIIADKIILLNRLYGEQ